MPAADWTSLRPYQRLALESVRDRTVDRGIVAIATGGGKGHIAGHLTEAVGSDRVLYLAHREELIDQLHRHVSRVIGGSNVSVEIAGTRSYPWSRSVIASVPTLAASGGRRLEQFEPGRFDAVVCDEVHHGTAESYLRIWRHFGILDVDNRKPERSAVPFIGLTATPSRGDGVGLHAIADAILFQYPIAQAINDGWLVPIHAYTVETGVDLDAVRTRGRKGDYVESELAQVVATDERNAIVFDSHQRDAKGLRTLVFCVDVNHAMAMASHFERGGVAARWISGAMSSDDRRRTLAWFRQTPGAVLCNVAVLSEGTDVPGIECVVMARPTKSATLFAQCIGRGTRLADGSRDYAESVVKGKAHCVLLDITDCVSDVGRRAVRIGDLFGLPLPTKKLSGQSVTKEAEDQQRELDLEAARVSTTSRRVDLFAALPPPPAFCKFSWLDLGGSLRLNVPKLGTVRVQTDLMDQWTVELSSPEKREWTPIVSPMADQRSAVAEAERLIGASIPRAAALLGKSAAWRDGEPSEKQLELCRKYRIHVPEGATKGQVSAALDVHFARKSARRVG